VKAIRSFRKIKNRYKAGMVQIERKLIYEYVYDSDECDVLLEIVYS